MKPVLFLLGAVSAIRFFDLPSEENTQVFAEMKSLSKQDDEILATIDHTLDQAHRNIEQGEIGRTLAMNKINEIKVQLMQFKTNFGKEAVDAVTDGAVGDNDGEPIQKLADKKKNAKELERKQREMEKRLPRVHDLEVDLGLEKNIEDQDLLDVSKSMAQQMDKIKAALRSQSLAEAKAEEEKNPQES